MKRQRCEICKWLKRVGYFLPGVLGYATVIELFFRFSTYQGELLELISGVKGFFDMGPDTQKIVMGSILTIVGVFFISLGRFLHRRWYCWEHDT